MVGAILEFLMVESPVFILLMYLRNEFFFYLPYAGFLTLCRLLPEICKRFFSMQGLSTSCIQQRFPLIRCSDSNGKKSQRRRKTREERRTMAESFINKYSFFPCY